ncbi:MAG TPA: hypothetical protein VNB90_17100 [Cytophagaceae bacterium]|jgi:hypothetical protein|nr:hypothetical protein [Cytophagaceae bacterium]
MKTIQTLLQELLSLTTQIETNYPELYQTLDETPIFLGKNTSGDMTTKELESYLNTLKTELKNYIVNHPKNHYK